MHNFKPALKGQYHAALDMLNGAESSVKLRLAVTPCSVYNGIWRNSEDEHGPYR